MVQIKKISINDKADLEFLQKLYLESFPPNERRSVLKMNELIDKHPMFQANVLTDSSKDNERMGFFTYWTFDTFTFLEHFAISPKFRNGGYGKKALEELFSVTELPLIGEIELPSFSDFALRRSKFYERIGFKIWDIPYAQPSFTDENEFIPLKLISYRNIDLNILGEDVINQIYKEVYPTVKK